jgi:hypothetical protein
MKQEFMNKLRFLSDRAAEALKNMESPDAADALYGALREAQGEEKPEERDGDVDGDGKGDTDASEGGSRPGGRADPENAQAR